MRAGWVLVLLVVLVAPAMAYTYTVDFLPNIVVMDLTTSHEVNNMTIECDTDYLNGTWQLLGSEDQSIFSIIDGRRYITGTAGVMQQFNFTNDRAFRFYYLQLLEGPPVGSNLEVHLNYSTPLQTPAEQLITPFNFTVRHPPVVQVFDFNQSGTGTIGYVQNYTILTNISSIGSEWYMFGTNTSPLLGEPGDAATLIDSHSSTNLIAGTTYSFDIAHVPAYRYYVLYVKSGFFAEDTWVEIRFFAGTGPTAPINYTPVFNVTSIVHQNQTFVNDKTGATPMPVWIGSVAMGIILLMISCVIPFPRGEEGLVSIMAWFPIGYSVFTAFKIDTVTGYGVTSYAGEFVLMEQHMIYHFDMIAMVLLVLFGFAIGNTYRIWVTQKKAAEKPEDSWHDRHGRL
jgi:hypothetical protein